MSEPMPAIAGTAAVHTLRTSTAIGRNAIPRASRSVPEAIILSNDIRNPLVFRNRAWSSQKEGYNACTRSSVPMSGASSHST